MPRVYNSEYLRFKRGRLYWCFVDFEKAFDSIQRAALWYKMRRNGISDNMVKCIREMYDGIKMCEMWTGRGDGFH
jgi:hypothetical protein